MELEYFSTAKEKYFGTNCQMKLELPEGFLPTFVPPVVTEATTTAEPTTEVITTTEEPKKKGCRGSITSTAMVCCTLSTSLAAFAVRKRKYD